VTGALGLAETAGSDLIVRYRASQDGGTGLPQRAGHVTPGSQASPDVEEEPGGNTLALMPRQLPAAVAHFVGRAAELKVLDGLLGQAPGSRDRNGGAVIISAIGGTAGVGKTVTGF
jgi:hypothetical protein